MNGGDCWRVGVGVVIQTTRRPPPSPRPPETFFSRRPTARATARTQVSCRAVFPSRPFSSSRRRRINFFFSSPERIHLSEHPALSYRLNEHWKKKPQISFLKPVSKSGAYIFMFYTLSSILSCSRIFLVT